MFDAEFLWADLARLCDGEVWDIPISNGRNRDGRSLETS